MKAQNVSPIGQTEQPLALILHQVVAPKGDIWRVNTHVQQTEQKRWRHEVPQ